MKNSRLRLGTALAFVAAISASSTPGFAQQNTRARLDAANAEYAAFRKQSSACNWEDTLHRFVADAEVETARAMAVLEDRSLAAVTPPTATQAPCNSEADGKVRSQASIRVWEWTTRLNYIHLLQQTAPWAKDLIPVDPIMLKWAEPTRAQIEKGLMQGNGAEAVNKAKDVLQRESVAVLRLACDGRKLLRSPTPRACPVLTAQETAQVAMATVRAEQSESLAKWLARAVPLQMRPDPARPYYLQVGNLSRSDTCAAGDWVVYPDAADTKTNADGTATAVLRKFGDKSPTRLSAKLRRRSGGNFDVLELPKDVGISELAKAASLFMPCINK
ncbi:hypothetical protein OKA06_09600 [Novosphingobium sp. MW5]|nr:hypothetical protein [Novosphingobium sp. MW5]